MKEIDGKFYEFIIASDIVRNGIGVELYEIEGDAKKFLAEIFRNDELKQIQFVGTSATFSLSVLNKLNEVFEKEIPKEFDC